MFKKKSLLFSENDIKPLLRRIILQQYNGSRGTICFVSCPLLCHEPSVLTWLQTEHEMVGRQYPITLIRTDQRDVTKLTHTSTEGNECQAIFHRKMPLCVAGRKRQHCGSSPFVALWRNLKWLISPRRWAENVLAFKREAVGSVWGLWSADISLSPFCLCLHVCMCKDCHPRLCRRRCCHGNIFSKLMTGMKGMLRDRTFSCKGRNKQVSF